MSARTIQARSPLDPHVDDTDDVVVRVNGTSISGWKTVDVERRLDAVSGTFRLSIQHVEPWPITAGDAVEIYIGDVLLMTGYVDSIDATIDSESSELVVSGRDKTQDLVDCAAPESPTELRSVTLEQIATHVAQPYDVEVITRLNEDLPFEVWRANAGESAWSAIERGCRKRGALAFADERGRLVLAFPATARTERDIGPGDWLSASLSWTAADRFQTYVVTGQRPGNDDAWGAVVAEARGVARDAGVQRPRVLVKVAEGPVNQAEADQYAAWLATVRAARSAQISIKLLGWRQTPRTGPLWQVNQLVGVNLPRWRLRGELLLINAVRFQYPPRTVTLELSRRDAYSAEPQVDTDNDPLRGWGNPSLAPIEDD